MRLKPVVRNKSILSLVNTRQPLKSKTYNLREFRAEEGEAPQIM